MSDPVSFKKSIIVVLIFIFLSLALLWKAEKADKASFFFTLTKMQALAQKKAQMMALNFFIPDFSDLILFHQHKQRPDKAQWQYYRDYYQRVIEFVPDLPDGYMMKGLSLYYLGDMDGALDSYKKAIEVNPNIFLSYYNLAIVLLKKGYDEQALLLLTRALKTDPLANIKYLLSSQVFSQIFTGFAVDNKVEYIKNNLEKSYGIAYQLSLVGCYKMKACPNLPQDVPSVEKIDLAVF